MDKKLWVIIGVVIAAIIIGAAVFLFMDPDSGVDLAPGAEEDYHIGLLQMAPTVATNMEGFIQGMEDIGYEEGIRVRYTYKDAEGDPELVFDLAEELVQEDPDMIFANTSLGTKAAKEATEGEDIPVVYSMVADPVEAGLIESMESSGNHLTGTSCAYVDVAPRRLETLLEVKPEIETVLTFYVPGDPSGEPANEKIEEAAAEEGVEVVSVEIESADEVESYLEDLEPGEVDAIMDPADATATSGLVEYGIDKGIELEVPVFMLARIETEAGAAASYGVDYVDLGEQAAPLASQVLEGVDPANIPSKTPRTWDFALNKETLDKINLEVEEEVMERADVIYEEIVPFEAVIE